MSAFVVSWPVFGVPMVPSPAKILFGVVLSMLMFPIVEAQGLALAMSIENMVWLSMKEVFIGLSIGFLARMFFFAISIGGQTISVSMGLSASQLYNPALGEQSTTVDQLYIALASLFFLAINGHHIFLSGLVTSYELVPIGPGLLSAQAFSNFGQIMQQVMTVGVMLSAPVMISVLFSNLAMAVIGRAVPQINVLITSLPINILLGILVMIVTVPLLLTQMHDILHQTAERLFAYLKAL